MCLCSGGDMDISPDARICVTTCPFCKKRFILEMVFTTHLLAHINYYHRFSYDDNNYRDQLFMCSLCDYNHYDIHVVTSHVESLHSAKYRIEGGSALERHIEAENLQIRYISDIDFRSLLGQKIPK